ncbi:MAG: polymer-forming cytoskeletal protein [Pseudomonadota bacterium]
MRSFSLGKSPKETIEEAEPVPIAQRRPTPQFATTTSRPLERETLICDDILIRGDLASKERLVVEGTIEGEVTGSSVEIGEQGRVRGAIVAETVTVRGSVEGTITARTVQLTRSAKVEGDILHQGIGIEMGTHYDGRLKWNGPRPDDATSQATPTPQAMANNASASPSPISEPAMRAPVPDGTVPGGPMIAEPALAQPVVEPARPASASTSATIDALKQASQPATTITSLGQGSDAEPSADR